MILKRVHPEMPTTTVALDLLSRVGSATKYSLSPFLGFASETLGDKNEFQVFRDDASFERIIRSKDNFSFHQENVFYSLFEYMEEDEDSDCDDDIIDDDRKYAQAWDVPLYEAGDKSAPQYIRRFEDYTKQDKIRDFLMTVVYNSMNNNDGFRKIRQRTSKKIQVEDNESVDESELMVEPVNNEEREALTRGKIALIRSMYRLMYLSRELDVSMISILLAYCRFYRNSTSKIECKPQELQDNGPIYAVDSYGNCTVELPSVNDRRIKRAREVYWTRSTSDRTLVDEYWNDCDTFIRCISSLGISAKHCRAELYTFEWVSYYSQSVLVDNYTYICRKHGGYSMETLTALRGLSLDMAVNKTTEVLFDGYSKMIVLLENLSDDVEIPPRVISELRKSNVKNITDTLVILAQILVEFDSDSPLIYQPYEAFSTYTTEDGFILSSNTHDVYYIVAGCLLTRNQLHHTTGNAFVHCTGWIVFEPVDDVLIITNLNTILKHSHTSESMVDCPKYIHSL